VTLTGTSLTGASAVSFGSAPATSFTINSAKSATAVAPPHTSGTAYVTVTTPGGTSSTAAGNKFTYIVGPVVTSISPTTGPLAGGTSVVLTGAAFTGATSVLFGSKPAASFKVDTATKIAAKSPAGARGGVQITVTTPGGTSATGPGSAFLYGTATTLTITAGNESSVYGGSPGPASPAYTGFLDGDTAAALTTPPTCTTSATSSSPVGTYTTSCSGAVDPSYSFVYVNGTATVTPAPLTIAASSPTSVYGSGVPVVTPSYFGFVNGDAATNLTTQPTCTATATVTSCAGAVDPNYAIVYVAGTVGVTTVALAITASSSTSVYGTRPPAVTPTFSGFVNGDTAAALTTQPTCTSAGTATSPAGTYVTTCSGATDPNYTVVYVAGTMVIQVAPTTTMVFCSPNPTTPGVAVTCIANLSGTVGGPRPISGASIDITSGATDLGTAVTDAVGDASVTSTTFPVGTDPVTATFSGDTGHGSSSGNTSEVVATVPTTTTVACTPSPTPVGTTVGCTANLSATDGGGAISGATVSFASGATSLGSGTTDLGGNAVVTTSTLPVGTDPITATYAGSTTYNSSSSNTTEAVTAAVTAPVLVEGGTVAANTTWSPQQADVYEITAELVIPAGVTLTIAPGTVVKANHANTGYANCTGAESCSIDVQGTLDAVGTAASPIVFTSLNDNSVGGNTGNGTPYQGDWYGVFADGAGSLDLEYATVDYAGNGGSSCWCGSWPASGGVSVTTTGTVVLTNDTFDSDVKGVLSTTSASTSVTDSTFDGTSAPVDITGTGSATVTGDTFNGGTGTPVTVWTPGPTIENNTVNQSTSTLSPAYAVGGAIDLNHIFNNTASGGGAHGFELGGPDSNGNPITDTVTTSSTMDARSSPYEITAELVIPAGVTLTIAPGTVVKAIRGTNPNSCTGFESCALDVQGTLDAVGTPSSPVVFTSLNDNSVGGNTGNGTPGQTDWYGIFADGGGSLDLEYTTVSHAGYPYAPAWWNQPTAYPAAGGVSVTTTGTVVLTNDNFDSDLNGVAVVSTATPVAMQGDTLENSTTGLNVVEGTVSFRGTIVGDIRGIAACEWGGSCLVDAAYVYWGAPGGANTPGATTACGEATISPWYTTADESTTNSGTDVYAGGNCDGTPTPDIVLSQAMASYDAAIGDLSGACVNGDQSACQSETNMETCLALEVTDVSANPAFEFLDGATSPPSDAAGYLGPNSYYLQTQESQGLGLEPYIDAIGLPDWTEGTGYLGDVALVLTAGLLIGQGLGGLSSAYQDAVTGTCPAPG
jgi:hypothetical protein